MSLIRRYNLMCDKCLTEISLNAVSPAKARQAAKRWGWTRIEGSGRGRTDGEDRCPRHPVEAD